MALKDINAVKRNIVKLRDAGAPDEDIDAYVQEEGYTPEQILTPQTEQKPQDGIDWTDFSPGALLRGAAATVKELPTIAGATIGGIAGGGTPASVPLAALGGAAGKSVQNIAGNLIDLIKGKQPKSTTEQSNDILSAGIMGAGQEMGGQILSKAIPPVVGAVKSGFGKAGQGISDMAEKAGEFMRPSTIKAPSIKETPIISEQTADALFRALKPGVNTSKGDFVNKLNRVYPKIVEASKKSGIPINDIDNLLEVIKRTQKETWDEYMGIIQKAGGTKIPLQADIMPPVAPVAQPVPGGRASVSRVSIPEDLGQKALPGYVPPQLPGRVTPELPGRASVGQAVPPTPEPIPATVTVEQEFLINGNDVARQIKSEIDPYFRNLEPQTAKKIKSFADRYKGKSITIEEAQNYLKTINSKLTEFYRQDQFGRAVDWNDPAVKSVKIESEALTKALDDAVDRATLGMGDVGKEMRRTWGALREVEKIAFKRSIVAGRQNPVSLQESVNIPIAAAKTVAGAFTGNAGQSAEGLAQLMLSKRIKDINSTNGLIQKAFRGIVPKRPVFAELMGKSAGFSATGYPPNLADIITNRRK